MKTRVRIPLGTPSRQIGNHAAATCRRAATIAPHNPTSSRCVLSLAATIRAYGIRTSPLDSVMAHLRAAPAHLRWFPPQLRRCSAHTCHAEGGVIGRPIEFLLSRRRVRRYTSFGPSRVLAFVNPNRADLTWPGERILDNCWTAFAQRACRNPGDRDVLVGRSVLHVPNGDTASGNDFRHRLVREPVASALRRDDDALRSGSRMLRRCWCHFIAEAG